MDTLLVCSVSSKVGCSSLDSKPGLSAASWSQKKHCSDHSALCTHNRGRKIFNINLAPSCIITKTHNGSWIVWLKETRLLRAFALIMNYRNYVDSKMCTWFLELDSFQVLITTNNSMCCHRHPLDKKRTKFTDRTSPAPFKKMVSLKWRANCLTVLAIPWATVLTQLKRHLTMELHGTLKQVF